MKVRASIIVSEELLKAVDNCAAQRRETRSTFIEAALWAFVKRHAQNDKRNARDLEIINRNADLLNQEAGDVLGYSLW
jgi:predicted transcriptional regulator